MISCPKCGNKNSDNSTTCEKCGCELPSNNSNKTNKMGLKDLWENQSNKNKFYIIFGALILLLVLIISSLAVIYDNEVTKNSPVEERYANISNNSTSPFLELILPVFIHNLNYQSEINIKI
jgi:uncharacterized membrane protein YvbJ